jgi:hypothetical protein
MAGKKCIRRKHKIECKCCKFIIDNNNIKNMVIIDLIKVTKE